MRAVPELHPQYITDSQGRKTAVILPIEQYDQLLADLADIAVAAERREESSIPHDRVIAGLEEDKTSGV